MAKDAMSKSEAMKELLSMGVPAEKARKILASKGGPKGADIDAGMIYYLPANRTNSKVPEIFLTCRKRIWNTENFHHAAICLSATARSSESELVEAAKAVGAQSIRTAELGEPVMSLTEANSILLKECERRLAAKKATKPVAAATPDTVAQGANK